MHIKFGIRARFLSMAKTTTQCVENLEEVVVGVQGDTGSLKEQLRLTNDKFEQFFKVQEENTRSHSSFFTSKAKEKLNLIAGGIEGFVSISSTRHDL